MREASRRGARYALIIGEEEARLGRYGLKRMADGEQVQVDLVEVERRLAGGREAVAAAGRAAEERP
jgi:histidyl-tRNA synthetase